MATITQHKHQCIYAKLWSGLMIPFVWVLPHSATNWVDGPYNFSAALQTSEGTGPEPLETRAELSNYLSFDLIFPLRAIYWTLLVKD